MKYDWLAKMNMLFNHHSSKSKWFRYQTDNAFDSIDHWWPFELLLWMRSYAFRSKVLCFPQHSEIPLSPPTSSSHAFGNEWGRIMLLFPLRPSHTHVFLVISDNRLRPSLLKIDGSLIPHENLLGMFCRNFKEPRRASIMMWNICHYVLIFRLFQTHMLPCFLSYTN